LTVYRKPLKVSKFMRIHPVAPSCPMRTDRRTYAFRNFPNAPKQSIAIRTYSWYRTEHTAFYRAS